MVILPTSKNKLIHGYFIHSKHVQFTAKTMFAFSEDEYKYTDLVYKDIELEFLLKNQLQTSIHFVIIWIWMAETTSN